jgi:cell division initiation protein
MRITPLDLRNHRFPRRMAGYATDEVDDFLRLVSEDYEAVLRKLESQREQVVRLETRVKDLEAHEQVLQDTLTTAHKLSEDLRRTAMKEAEVLVSEAEVKGEKILEAAHRRASKLADDIREMKLLKTRLSAAVRSAIETHLRLLEGLAADAPDDGLLEGRLAYLAPERPLRAPETTRAAEATRPPEAARAPEAARPVQPARSPEAVRPADAPRAAEGPRPGEPARAPVRPAAAPNERSADAAARDPRLVRRARPAREG